MIHEPLGFVSGAFNNAQVRCHIVDKEPFSIVSTCRRFEYLFLGGFANYCDHRNLAYFEAYYSPESDKCIAVENSCPTPAEMQRLLRLVSSTRWYTWREKRVFGETFC